MVPLIITLIILLLFTIYLIFVFISDIVALIVNIPILWVVLIRSYFEIRNQKKIYNYLTALGITTLMFLFLFDKIQTPFMFWPVWFITVVFIIAELINLILICKKRLKTS